jgi:hypothetical protein
MGERLRCSLFSAFYRKLTGTADMPQLILGHLVTQEGFVCHQSLAHCVVGGCALGSVGEVDCLTASLRDYFRRFLSTIEVSAFDRAWTTYLTVLDFLPQEATQHFWVRQAPLRLIIAGESISFLLIAEMILILLWMPCNEAEVERVFTRLRHLFGDHARHSQGDQIEAHLTIMINNLGVTTKFMRSSLR